MDDSKRWASVQARDPSAEGTFFYAVRTTKCFCRPTCKARLPRRANVEFFLTQAEAEAAGYRSCKRCKPMLASYTPEADKIKKACDLLDSLPSSTPIPGLDRLAQEAGLTKHHFHRLFKREIGVTPREYALRQRREGRSVSTSEGTDSSAGMTPITPFENDFQMPTVMRDDSFDFLDPQLGMFVEERFSLPQEINGLIVYYNIVTTSCGHLLLAFQDGQLCKLEFGLEERELLGRLETAYPSIYYYHLSTTLADAADAVLFNQQTASILESVEDPAWKLVDLPLTVQPNDLQFIT